ncbi:adenosylmethionine-8-amino-7-oxononanoate transaminase [Neorickettsia helminthoeca str. Oregon]|uniref:Adenosylmethionine-8-amino-7-oxononanoate aminotransferase n=1 Tax=Neorickettsia helminthoeca str. Oregon TaxID=1286528 RepID=X5HM68_9RICK|nr:adenosylmethionine--8-amino-7-oxononanoate transaminase [Neorickettsia helminthoeca]AHX11530.1 adenosylmethionine-8-amino-7-oxononanoate transaminase [Neorickettsia helminthoeca str. Oregon]
MTDLTERDRKLIWHPYTQEKTAPLPIAITRGENECLYDDRGNKYIDLISSWWVNLHGHSNPVIAKAIYDQALKLEQVIFADCTHELAISLCENLKASLPQTFSKFFFSDNGSTAVEVALKMTLQFWQNRNQENRNIFLSFDKGYHGDTVGAMSVGISSDFFSSYERFLFSSQSIPYPATWIGDPDVETKEESSLKMLERFLKENSGRVAGFILEPLVQGASGMRMCRPEYLERILTLLRKHEVILIFDEVMTGFYRTGKMFALDYLSITPDILCLSKGLTGGFLPLSLTITTREIYDAFLDNDFRKALVHGHSYTANPLGCAAAIASLKLLKDENTLKAIANIEKLHKNFLSELAQSSLDCVKARRVCGTIAAFNLFSEESDYNHPIVKSLKEIFLEKGLLIRPLGNTIYLIPPYCISQASLEEAYNKILEVITSIHHSKKVSEILESQDLMLY